MTPWQHVDYVTGRRESDSARQRAVEIMDKYKYSGVPLVAGATVVGAFVRTSPTSNAMYQAASPAMFVGPRCDALDVLQLLNERKRSVLVVGTAVKPRGWVTYADFTKRPVRVLLFAMISEIEHLLASLLDAAHPDESWPRYIPRAANARRSPFQILQQEQRRAEDWDVTMPLSCFATLSQLVAAACHSPALCRQLDDDPNVILRLKRVTALRNRVAHIVKPVIAGPTQIQGIASVVLDMLTWISRWPKVLNSVACTPSSQ